MPKDLNYYMSLKYKLEVTPMPEDEGGGYYAHYPDLGPAVGCGDGPTVAEAIASADSSKQLFFESALDRGDPITEPEVTNSDLA
ncbi:MAG: type II toxin-antitoxin system HicB family antitoxin [Deinococcota bacterium]